LSNPRRADARRLARAADELIMRPVRKELGDTRRLFLSPDGALNLIPFGALVDERERHLVEDYSITYLTSGRDLLRLSAKAESRQGALVLADPTFDLGAPRADAAQNTNAPAAQGRRSLDFAGALFSRLPGTEGEARALGATVPGVKVLTGAQASEGALKAVSGPSVLHVATHGFFLPDRPRADVALTRGTVAGDAAPAGENPLLRSGLALAGANTGRAADGEDGVLTALEAAGLDLWGTKLVVLSACETGVGQVENGEGVYGLRRALVLAGAESQVMSLWQVSDDATRDLMIDYYKRLQAGEGRTEALRQVQLSMLRSGAREAAGAQRGLAGQAGQQPPPTAGDRSHPFYWASFIQSGEWRGLKL
ncbi:MAG TPA: CHAT domain-containing protein, partial [Pyrinomonadaceae bacterium]